MIYVVMSLGRQIDGEYNFLRSEKAFKNPDKAKKFVEQLKAKFVQPTGEPKPVRIKTPNGEAECICEVGIFEMEVEE